MQESLLNEFTQRNSSRKSPEPLRETLKIALPRRILILTTGNYPLRRPALPRRILRPSAIGLCHCLNPLPNRQRSAHGGLATGDQVSNRSGLPSGLAVARAIGSHWVTAPPKKNRTPSSPATTQL